MQTAETQTDPNALIPEDTLKMAVIVIGTVPISKKVTIDGQRKTAIYHKKVRWDATGHCFSQRSNVRQRNYDLPIPTILQWEKQAKEFKNLG